MYAIVIAVFDEAHAGEPEYTESISTWGAFSTSEEADAYLEKSGIKSKPYYRWHQVCHLVK